MIIAFGHRKRVGKDTSVKFLLNYLKIQKQGSKSRAGSFAFKLKLICSDLYGWAGVKPPSYYDEYSKAKDDYLPLIGMTVRELWVEVGNRMRDVFPETWINYLLKTTYSSDITLLINDLRYPNEAQLVKQAGGFCIKIIKPDVPETDDEADIALKHWDSWDKVIINDGTLWDLNVKVIKVYEELCNAEKTIEL